MILPRSIIKNITIKIYHAIKSQSNCVIYYDNHIAYFDVSSQILLSHQHPVFLLTNLFRVTEIGDGKWKISVTDKFKQLVGDVPVTNNNLIYYVSRYRNIDTRLAEYVEQILNK